MKVTLIGHASIFIETESLDVLMDPVLFDPFEEGAVTSCPERVVYPDKIPQPDVLIVTHRHPDHFDIRSLATISRECIVFCPHDVLIQYALKKIGFKNISTVTPMQTIRSWGIELTPTRSEESTSEFGVILHDGEGTFWNQVDTVISKSTVANLMKRYSVNLLFARYASQNFEFFDTPTMEFPYDEHRQNIETVLSINPKTVAPGSAGFKFCGDHAWLNKFLFPVSRERFVRDLQSLNPEIQTHIMNPGDVMEIARGSVSLSPGASGFVKMVRDDTDAIRFDPTAGIPELGDPNPSGYSDDFLETGVSNVIQKLFDFCVKSAAIRLSLPWLYRENRVAYNVEVIFSSKKELWQFDFQGHGITVSREPRREADMIHKIAAAALLDWTLRRRSFSYVRAYSRRASTLYRAFAGGSTTYLQRMDLPDLLMYYQSFASEDSAEAAKKQVDYEIEKCLRWYA